MTQAKTEHKCRVINDLLLDLENDGSIPSPAPFSILR